jgi:hypothetical protein
MQGLGRALCESQAQDRRQTTVGPEGEALRFVWGTAECIRGVVRGGSGAAGGMERKTFLGRPPVHKSDDARLGGEVQGVRLGKERQAGPCPIGCHGGASRASCAVQRARVKRPLPQTGCDDTAVSSAARRVDQRGARLWQGRRASRTATDEEEALADFLRSVAHPRGDVCAHTAEEGKKNCERKKTRLVLAKLAHRPWKIRNGVEAKWARAGWRQGVPAPWDDSTPEPSATPPDHHAAVRRACARRSVSVRQRHRRGFIAVDACRRDETPRPATQLHLHLHLHLRLRRAFAFAFAFAFASCIRTSGRRRRVTGDEVILRATCWPAIPPSAIRHPTISTRPQAETPAQSRDVATTTTTTTTTPRCFCGRRAPPPAGQPWARRRDRPRRSAGPWPPTAENTKALKVACGHIFGPSPKCHP